MDEIIKGQVWVNKYAEKTFIVIKSVNLSRDIVKALVEVRDGEWKTLTYSVDGILSYWKLTDKCFTRVLFKKFSDGDVIAFLLDNDVNPSRVDSYMHVGQHSEASEDLPSSLKACTVGEYSYLKEELESMGYLLQVVRSPSKYAYRG